jgi:peptide/nickel transport system substrate-binding protein
MMAGAAMLIAGTLAACGTGTSGSSGSGSNGTLTIDDETGQQWNCSFNPFNPANTGNGTTFGQVYEPLAYVDPLANAKTTPWLATKWAWSNGNKTLTFTIRNGVKFSDGTPMSAADVAFTFNMMKKNKGLDLNSVWSVLSSVKQSGNTVVFDFKSPASTYFYYIADQTPIVPEHIWSKVSNPVSYNDPKPVGTGAYTISSCTPQNIAYTANKKYYQPGKPKVTKVNFPAFTSNNTANTYLTTDQAQWGSQFLPNIQKVYAKTPGHSYWFPPIANVSLIPNLTVPGLSDVKVRQAMAYAIDRPKAASVGEYGEEPGANQTDVATPTFKDWQDSKDSAKYGNYAYNPAKAKQILESDGYKPGKNGIMAKNGKELSFSVMNVGGYSDWVATMSVVVAGLKAAGINVTPQNVSTNDLESSMMDGKFQLAYYDQTAGPTPEYELRQWLFSGNTAPIGKQASTDWERYSSPATDKLFGQYAATTSTAKQHQIVDQLQQVMLSDVPVIPITQEVDWFQYNTNDFTGWPTKSNPYALPAIYAYPDLGQVLLHLAPKG